MFTLQDILEWSDQGVWNGPDM